jgi:hypothetical protein
MTNFLRPKFFIKIIAAFLITPWISGLIYYVCSWSAPLIEGNIDYHLSYLKTYQIYPWEEIVNFSILFYFPIILFGIPILLICTKLKKSDLKTYLLVWTFIGVALGLTFSGLFWSIDEKESFQDTYWVLYSIPISMAFGGTVFWFLGIGHRHIKGLN